MTLDPLLAVAVDPIGRPRFYPAGAHPALEQARTQLARIRELRAVLELAGDPDWARESEEYLLAQIAAFEEQHSEAKADYLRKVAR